jgi:hypothetical protein
MNPSSERCICNTTPEQFNSSFGLSWNSWLLPSSSQFSQYIETMSMSIWVFFSFQIAASSPDADLQNPYQLINTQTRSRMRGWQPKTQEWGILTVMEYEVESHQWLKTASKAPMSAMKKSRRIFICMIKNWDIVWSQATSSSPNPQPKSWLWVSVSVWLQREFHKEMKRNWPKAASVPIKPKQTWKWLW